MSLQLSDRERRFGLRGPFGTILRTDHDGIYSPGIPALGNAQAFGQLRIVASDGEMCFRRTLIASC
jgi:hypothetical protein